MLFYYFYHLKPRQFHDYAVFGFKSGIGPLIVPVPVHCFSITFLKVIIVHVIFNKYQRFLSMETIKLFLYYGD